MSLSRVASRYAKSLIDLGKKEDQIEAIYQDAQTFLQVCADNRLLVVSLENPIISMDKKKNIFKRLFENHLSEYTQKFVYLVLSKKRGNALKEIFEHVVRQYKLLNGIYDAQVYTSTELPDETKKKMKDKLKDQDVKEVKLENIVDESLIGGFVLKFGDKLWDASVASKLAHFNKALKN
ncbi:MAG: ATP synthase F1 subunit delta [Bacteroidetes bacterium SW_10_40_5]|nr:MAG: ATP synthase F1 subunit delta [Bacteroidetes bacterium SW_10_40_5]